jgi:hypothetical protein
MSYRSVPRVVEIGHRLSSELVEVSFASLDDLAPFASLRDEFAAVMFPNGFPDVEADPKSAVAASEKLTEAVRAVLAEDVLAAYVRSSDGLYWKIPRDYWGSFHDFRPLAGAGFCAVEAKHGSDAAKLNDRPMFVRASDLIKARTALSAKDKSSDLLDLEGGTIADYAGGQSAAAFPRWDYAQTLAWIIKRDIAAVNGVIGLRVRYASEPAHSVEATIAYILLQDGSTAAEREVSHRCSNGDIIARGRSNGSDQMDIPADQWDDASVYLQSGEYWLAPRNLYARTSVNRTHWSGLRFEARRVMNVWPANAPEISNLPTSQEAAIPSVLKVDTEKWYNDRVKDIGAGRSTRKEDELAGAERGINSPRIRELRQQFAPSHWKKQGRPKSDKKI